MKRHMQGFTFIELMVIVVILSILTTVAIPSFNEFVRSNRQVTNTNDLVAALQFTRSEAIRRGGPVTICSSSDGASCADAGRWEEGWIIFSDDPNFGEPDGADTVVREHGEVDGSETRIRADNDTISSSVTFLASGFAQTADGRVQSGVFLIWDSRGVENARSVILGNAGRVRAIREDIDACP